MRLFQAAICFLFAMLAAAPVGAHACNAYFREQNGESVAIKRIENFRGLPVEVWDVSKYVQEQTHLKDASMQIFNLSEVFAEQKMFLGFGKPNVYLAFPGNEGPYEKFAAKSLKRGDSQIVPMRTFSQSGLLMVFPELTIEQQSRLRQIAEQHVGTRRYTCVNANCRVMEEAGFTTGGKPLSEYYMPMTLLEQVLRHGLELDGKEVGFELVRTTPDALDGFRTSVNDSVKGTLSRHLNRTEWMIRFKERTREVFGFLYASKADETTTPATSDVATPAPLRLSTGQTEFNQFQLSVSEASRFGTFMRALWGPHQLFEVMLNSEQINQYLPQTLKPFPKENPSLVTRLKKAVLFSKSVVKAIRSQMARNFQNFSNQNEKTFYDMLETHTEAAPKVYNLVITGTKIIVTLVQGRSKIADWVLTKHVLMSGYDPDVRFAGEAMKLEDGVIHITLNSGTYMPGDELAEPLLQLLNELFPNIPFVIDGFTAP